MDKKNKISKILNYCPELLQQRIQGTEMALRLKQRHTLVTAGGRHLLQEAFMTGAQDTDRMNNPEYLHRRNGQNSICIQIRCKTHCSWTHKLMLLYVSLLYNSLLLYDTETKITSVLYQKVHHMLFFKMLIIRSVISPWSTYLFLVQNKSCFQ